MVAAAAPTEAVLRALCAQEHDDCFACRSVARGGLGLNFVVRSDGSVSTRWICPAGGGSYRGIVHGGLLATVLDSAMVHALFARGIVARTADLRIRYRRPAVLGEVLEVCGWLCRSCGALHVLQAEIVGGGGVCARAEAKFMATDAARESAEGAALGCREEAR